MDVVVSHEDKAAILMRRYRNRAHVHEILLEDLNVSQVMSLGSSANAEATRDDMQASAQTLGQGFEAAGKPH